MSIWKNQNPNLTPALLLILKYFPHGGETQKRTLKQCEKIQENWVEGEEIS